MPTFNSTSRSPEEIARLGELEARVRESVQEGEARFRECGSLLRTIKAETTYKSVNKSFARYVTLRFGFTGRYANNIIWHSEVCDLFSTLNLPLPLERQSRELYPLRNHSTRLSVSWTVASQRGIVGPKLHHFVARIIAASANTLDAANAIADALVTPSRSVRDPDLSNFNRVIRDLIANLRSAQDMDDVYNVFERLAQERPRVRLLSEAA